LWHNPGNMTGRSPTTRSSPPCRGWPERSARRAIRWWRCQGRPPDRRCYLARSRRGRPCTPKAPHRTDRTLLVLDDEILAQLDTALAEQATSWGPLSKNKLIQSADRLVDEHDPAAVRRTQTSARSRDVTIGDPDDEAGTASIWGRLYNTDAALLDRRLTAMAKAVCKDDPRTQPQRRADALGALAAGADHLACTCGRPDCPRRRRWPGLPHHGPHRGRPARPGRRTRPRNERRTTRTRRSGTGRAAAPGSRSEAWGRNRARAATGRADPRGAKVRHVQQPGNDPEPGYRSSTALAEFVRTRDLTCRFPGCDRPAELTDIDHTIAWPAALPTQ
jgi:hypothetical protein